MTMPEYICSAEIITEANDNISAAGAEFLLGAIEAADRRAATVKAVNKLFREAGKMGNIEPEEIRITIYRKPEPKGQACLFEEVTV
jgi:hypothetical protein